MIDNMPEAYHEGRTARSNKVKRSDNPHHINVNDHFHLHAFKQRDAHIQWNNGWDDRDGEMFSECCNEGFDKVDNVTTSTMGTVQVPLSTLTKLYELAAQAEYESNTGLCFHCGAAASPVYNKEHEPDCMWLTTIEEIEALLDKEM
jgi:hypothetical protein